MNQLATHLRIDPRLCGAPTVIEDGRSEVRLETTAEMIVDDKGLVHGGFVFGLADYAAMLAVNDPNVVLGSADVRFTAPVRAGDKLTAHAQIMGADGRQRTVAVEVRCGETILLKGEFSCFVLDTHVLEA